MKDEVFQRTQSSKNYSILSEKKEEESVCSFTAFKLFLEL